VYNAVRHARAHGVQVCIRVGDRQVEVQVTDDGDGVPAGYVPGVGLASMRERAAELGGHCTVEPVHPSGTRVRAVLPWQESS
jgi:signal transduction histidine kinase